jgi:hypothetical protein
MTYKEAAQAAIDCQDACNLSGVVFTFAEAMHAICEEGHRAGHGTDWKNTHPIVRMFLYKLTSLAGSFTSYPEDFTATLDIARKE